MGVSERYATHCRSEPFHPDPWYKSCKNYLRPPRSSTPRISKLTVLSQRSPQNSPAPPPSTISCSKTDFSRQDIPSQPNACFFENVAGWDPHLSKAVGSHAAHEVWARIDGRRTHAHQLCCLLLVVHVLPRIGKNCQSSSHLICDDEDVAACMPSVLVHRPWRG